MITPRELQRIDATKRMARRYRMEVSLDLFGAWVLTREWGRIGRRGQQMALSFSTSEAAQAALIKMQMAKLKRGYCLR